MPEVVRISGVSGLYKVYTSLRAPPATLLRKAIFPQEMSFAVYKSFVTAEKWSWYD
jgi:hypothetical protein